MPEEDEAIPFKRWMDEENIDRVAEELDTYPTNFFLTGRLNFLDYALSDEVQGDRVKMGKAYQIYRLMIADYDSRIARMEALKPFAPNFEE